MEFIAVEFGQARSDSSTLVLPALAIGNVGQLAVDLLIASYKAERIGYLDDPLVLPCVGNDAYGPFPQGDVALPLEAYPLSLYSKYLYIIVRKNGPYVSYLFPFLFGDHFSGLQVYYLSSCNDDGTNDVCNKFGWKKLEAYDPAQRRWKYLTTLAEGNPLMEDSSTFEDDEVEEDYFASLPFAALFSFLKAKGVEVTCLLCYCSEGDNVPEAFHLPKAASKYLKLSTKDIPS